jgi:hypothetical protein
MKTNFVFLSGDANPFRHSDRRYFALNLVTGLRNSVTRKPNAGAGSYAVTPVTQVPYTCACVCAGACVQVRMGMRDACVTGVTA